MMSKMMSKKTMTRMVKHEEVRARNDACDYIGAGSGRGDRQVYMHRVVALLEQTEELLDFRLGSEANYISARPVFTHSPNLFATLPFLNAITVGRADT
jgi:hypothetical protein